MLGGEQMAHRAMVCAMQKWEYCACSLGELKALNSLGAEGWEAVGIAMSPNDPGSVLLKRPVPERPADPGTVHVFQ